MKIAHVCIAQPYIEEAGYQENIMTQFHANMGLEVRVITTNKIFDNKSKTRLREEEEYINKYNVHVKSLSQKKNNFLSRYKYNYDVYSELILFKPEIIFVHGGQFGALKDVIKYCKKNKNVKLYIDQHADYYNTDVSTFRKRCAQGIIYGYWMRKAVKYTSKFWGVTPWRCKYLNEIYRIPKEDIDLLVMGGDDRFIKYAQETNQRMLVRKKLDIAEDDFVVISGGKIDKAKNIHLLVKAVNQIGISSIKLIVFGQLGDDMSAEFEQYEKNDIIKFIGWIKAEDVYNYYLASDLAVFPGTHSVLWEQACACGIPGIFKYWEGMQHVNINGSAQFLFDDDCEEIKQKIIFLYKNKDAYNEMKRAACKYSKNVFSYEKIARKAIEM